MSTERLALAIERLIELKSIKSKYITSSEACAMLDISKTTFYKLIKAYPNISIQTKSHRKYIFSEVLKLSQFNVKLIVN
ncbi:MAG TPA: hypothetical protein PK210_05150 [Bacteroidia bacterium]|nr:hypothetical protein [Bacteroidia bacterium]